MFSSAISSGNTPKYLSFDNDTLFQYHQWRVNVRILGTEGIKTVQFNPPSHPFFEQLIGTIRRELLGQMLFWNASDPERKLPVFRLYYNSHRTHTDLVVLLPMRYPGEAISASLT